MLARVRVRYPDIPIIFLETRPLAEEWAFRYLWAPLAEVETEQHPGSGVRSAELPLDYAPRRTPPRAGRRRKTGA